jgi:hypothetical protein
MERAALTAPSGLPCVAQSRVLCQRVARFSPLHFLKPKSLEFANSIRWFLRSCRTHSRGHDLPPLFPIPPAPARIVLLEGTTIMLW